MAIRTTVTLDDELLARAEQLCGPLERSALLRQALQALVQRESAKRLGALGGSDPALDPLPPALTKSASPPAQRCGFVPAPLPLEPPLALDVPLQALHELALLVCGRLDGVASLLPNP